MLVILIRRLLPYTGIVLNKNMLVDASCGGRKDTHHFTTTMTLGIVESYF